MKLGYDSDARARLRATSRKSWFPGCSSAYLFTSQAGAQFPVAAVEYARRLRFWRTSYASRMEANGNGLG